MQFLFLLMVNVILWVVFYLVISLKLERSASEFREKRLRREMDAVIKEFNETAERNISLLENRITVMKRLMKQGGVIKNLDMNVGDDVESLSAAEKPGTAPEEPEPAPAAERDAPPAGRGRVTTWRTVAGASDMLRAFAGKGAVPAGAHCRKAEVTYPERDERSTHKYGPRRCRRVGARLHPERPVGIRRRASRPPLRAGQFNETDIAGLFDESDDKYALISDLHGKGCPVELISRCSGIPAGEIRLVLNLHAKQ